MEQLIVIMDGLEYTVEHDELRAMRRQVINNHLWTMTVKYGWDMQFHNIRLMVRLYERQYYGRELQAYK